MQDGTSNALSEKSSDARLLGVIGGGVDSLASTSLSVATNAKEKTSATGKPATMHNKVCRGCSGCKGCKEIGHE